MVELGIKFLVERGSLDKEDEQHCLNIKCIRDPSVCNTEKSKQHYEDCKQRLCVLMEPRSKNSDEIPESVVGKHKVHKLHKFSAVEFPGYDKNNIFFIKYDCLVQLYQLSELCYLHAPTIVQTYSIVHSTKEVKNDVLDLPDYIKKHFSPVGLYRHIFNDKGGNSKMFLESILHKDSNLITSFIKEIPDNFGKYGPGLISTFKVYNDFMDEHRKFYGTPEGDYNGYHSMVLVGWRKEGEKLFFLLQNWWASKQFVEIDDVYLQKSTAIITFIETPQESIPGTFHHLHGKFFECEAIDKEDRYPGEL